MVEFSWYYLLYRSTGSPPSWSGAPLVHLQLDGSSQIWVGKWENKSLKKLILWTSNILNLTLFLFVTDKLVRQCILLLTEVRWMLEKTEWIQLALPSLSDWLHSAYWQIIMLWRLSLTIHSDLSRAFLLWTKVFLFTLKDSGQWLMLIWDVLMR